MVANYNFFHAPDFGREDLKSMAVWTENDAHVRQGVTILFLQFDKMGHFLSKWHDSNVIRCQLAVILMAKSSHFVSQMLVIHKGKKKQNKNVLTSFTYNNIELIVSNFNLSKNTFEKK